MKRRDLVQMTGALLLAASVFLTGGCGYKNSPVPPESVVPQAISDLRYSITDNGVRLSWSFPVETIKGSVIEDISSFDLLQAEIPLEDYCGSCPIPFGRSIEVDGGSPIDGQVRKSGVYEADMLRSGHKYFFKVRSRASWLAASADSNIVSFTWFQPAAAPQGLKAVAGDKETSLSWQPVNTLVDGKETTNEIRYQVLRSTGGKDFDKLGEPMAARTYVDRQVRNGVKYFYAVQSYMVFGDELVAGKTSSDVAVVPVDMTPPLPPAGVTAVRTEVGIKIFWDKSDEEDIGGYRVYRRSADKDTYELLGKVEPEYTLFVDRTAGDSVRYYYGITAVDTSTPANESNKSREATVRY